MLARIYFSSCIPDDTWNKIGWTNRGRANSYIFVISCLHVCLYRCIIIIIFFSSELHNKNYYEQFIRLLQQFLPVSGEYDFYNEIGSRASSCWICAVRFCEFCSAPLAQKRSRANSHSYEFPPLLIESPLPFFREGTMENYSLYFSIR